MADTRAPLPPPPSRRHVVYLRPPVAADWPELRAANRSSVRFFRGLARPMLDEARFTAWVARSRTPETVSLLICRTADDTIVGTATVSQIFRGPFCSGYLGYQVFAPFARQGWMRAAMPLILRYVFRTLMLHRLEANIQPANAPSIAVVRRAGFEREGYSPRYLKIAGRWRDHERWAITLERYRAVNARTAHGTSRPTRPTRPS